MQLTALKPLMIALVMGTSWNVTGQHILIHSDTLRALDQRIRNQARQINIYSYQLNLCNEAILMADSAVSASLKQSYLLREENESLKEITINLTKKHRNSRIIGGTLGGVGIVVGVTLLAILATKK